MADDMVMSAAEDGVKQLSNQLNELLERMTERKSYLQVRDRQLVVSCYARVISLPEFLLSRHCCNR